MPRPAARPRPRPALSLALLGAAAALAAALASPGAPAAQPARASAGPGEGAAAAPPLFARPELQRRLRAVAGLFGQGDAIGAEIELHRVIRRFPRLADPRFALGQLLARRGEVDAALDSLRAAAERGARGADRLDAPVFASLRSRPEALAELRAALSAPAPPAAPPPPPATPAPLGDGVAMLTEANSEWSPGESAVRAYFAPPKPEDGPALAISGGDELALRLNRLHAAGRAAGNVGDFYENRDDDHSPLDLSRFPQLTPVEHGPAARAAGFARSLPEGLALSAGGDAPPLFGNSSTAVTSGSAWRSMARLALTEPGRAAELWRQYSSNQIYVYPEHRDHDPFFGDVFPANTPYYIVTQGSSFSDARAMRSVAMILAAFRPETKARLIRERLIAPAVQMIWRRGQAGMGDDAAYLSPAAHPTAFDPEAARPGRMIDLANALAADAIPPMVRLSVLQESQPTRGVTLFGDGLSETLLDTPSAVARIHRGTQRTKTMTLSAAGTRDPNDRPLTFAWVVLRGDPERVRVTPLGRRGEGAEIAVDWHAETRTPGGALRAQRVDIGVFAHNGAHWSAPAFVSVAFPPRQTRVWDDGGRLQMVDYDAVARQENYADPWLYPRREWRDVYSYDGSGRPLGWTRSGDAGFAKFTRHGARVEAEDALGRPVRGRVMAYPMGLDPQDARRVVQPEPEAAELLYVYEGPEDRQGAATPRRLE